MNGDVNTIRKVSATDAEYSDLVRGNNQRWVGQPATVYLPTSASEVETVVKELLKTSRLRFPVRSGGHCYEDYVFNREAKAVIDISALNTIEAGNGGIWIGAGCTLWDVYKVLHRRWGTTLPGGSCGTVGAGGHIAGGGYGLLSRRDGLTVDYLAAVELVDGTSKREIYSTLTPGSPLWAHTGGGGGNFGVVTRFLVQHLPKAPSQVLLHELELTWDQLGRGGWLLETMLSRYNEWCKAHAAFTNDTAKQRNLFALFRVFPRVNPAARAVKLTTQVAIDANVNINAARKILNEFIQAVVTVPSDDTSPTTLQKFEPLPWLNATHRLSQGTWNYRADYKSAYHRWLTADHISRLVAVFHTAGRGAEGARVALDTYGGKVNAIDRTKTAAPHRDSAIKLQWQTYWTDPRNDGWNTSWLRNAYESVYDKLPDATNNDATNKSTDGCFVNYLDADLPSDTWFNYYYGSDTYKNLQAAKKQLDPHNRFNHAQSIQPPT